jgi:hypothetical protein
VYTGNADEYGVSFASLVAPLALATAAAVLLLTAALWLVPLRWRGRAVVFVFSIATVAWLQGNWLLRDVGLLDGEPLDLGLDLAARVSNAALWVGIAVVAQLAYAALRRRVVFAAAVLVGLQLVSLPLTTAIFGARPPGRAEAPSLVASDEIFGLSRRQNIILLILDSFTGDTFRDFVRRDPEHYDRAYAGFTLYAETTGAFPSTQYSIPVMLGALPYDNRTSIDDYMVASLRHGGINGPLLERGFAVDWVSAWPLFCLRGLHSSCYAIPRPYASPAVVRRHTAAELVDLSLFRHAPDEAKAWIYREGEWLVQAAVRSEQSGDSFVASAARFAVDFNQQVRVDREKPTFKIIHTGGGHVPFVLDESCTAVESQPHSQRSYEQQARCSLMQAEEFLGRLRELGLYRGATIVIAGDHGASFGTAAAGSHGLTRFRLARSRPLLAVKWPGAEGGLTVSIYMLRNGKPGGHLERVERYGVTGISTRPESWAFEGAVFSPAVSLAGELVDVGGADADRLSYLGWQPHVHGVVRRTAAAAVGPVSTVFADLPRTGPVELRARLKGADWALPQIVAVEVDRVPVGRWRIEAPGFSEHVLALPEAFSGRRAAAISFLPEKTRRPGRAGTWHTFELDWLRLGAAAASAPAGAAGRGGTRKP